MKTNKKAIAVSVSLLCILLLSCGIGQIFAPTATPQPTFTPTLTNTPTPTNTPQPTSTSTPTSTPTPTINLQDPMDKYLSNITVTSADWFDTLSTDTWGCNSVNVTDGMLLVNGGSGCSRLTTFHEGEGVLISFKLDKDSNFEFYFDDRLGQWDTNSYKRFGFATGPRNGTEASVWNGKNWIGSRLRSPKPEIWYDILLAVGKDTKFLLLVWERDNPTSQIVYNGQFTKWNGAEWKLEIGSFYGTVHFDNYAEISFSEMK